MRWLDAASRFEFSTKLRALGELETNANLALNIDAGDADSVITFYKPTSGTQTLRWDKTNFYFKFDAKLFIDGDLEVTGDLTVGGSGLTLQAVTDAGNETNHDVKIENLYINFNGGIFNISDVGYKSNDTTPPSGGPTSWGYTGMHDGDLTTQVIAAGADKDSVYIDLGAAQLVDKLRHYDNRSEDGIYGGGGFDHYAVYYSADGTTWTLLEDFNPVTRTAGTGYHYVEVTLSTPTSARYWKLHCPENALAGGVGTQLNHTEVRALGSGGSDSDSYIYFWEGDSQTGAYLQWDNTNTRFKMSHGLYVTGQLRVNTDAYLNALQANADVVLNFGNGDGGNSSLYLQNSDHTFHMSKSLFVSGSQLELSGAGFAVNTDHSNVDVNLSLGVFPSGFATLRWDTALSAFRILSGSNLYFDGGLFQLNHGAGAGDVTIQFQKTSGSQNFKYSQANSRFEMDANFATVGDIVLNSDSGNVDVVLTFTKSSGSETLKWVAASTYFKFSNKLYVAGDILSDGNLELNEDLTDANVLITFWKVAQTAVNTGAFAPTATDTGTWTNGANVKVSDDAWATSAGFNQIMTSSIYNLPAIPFGSVIVGIEVILEGQAYGTTDAGVANVGVELSWDGGTSFSTGINNAFTNTTPATTAPTGANDSNLTYGGPTTLFAGHTWVYSDFTNTNLFVRFRNNGNSAATTSAVDYVTIKVYYKPPASQVLMWDKTNLWFNMDSALQIQGSFQVPFYTRTQADYSTYTLNATDFTVYADTTAGSMTVTLPTAIGIAGRIYVIKKKVAANTLTINTTSSQTIDGATSWADTDQYATLMVQSDGANWIKLSSIGTWL